MTRRVLIIASSYDPAMIADVHRARLLAWELPKLGWDVEILCPDKNFQVQSYLDDDSSGFFPPNIPIHWVEEWYPRILRTLGFGSIGFRALGPMLYAGRQLLQRKRFDLVFISTAKFPLFLLGPALRKWFKIPFVLDLHDPCYKEDTTHPVWSRPNLKHTASRWLGKYIESNSVPSAAGLVSVSQNYIETMCRRYAKNNPTWSLPGNCAVLPFAARPDDLREAENGIERSNTDAKRPATIIYVGAGGPIMAQSFSLICRTLSRLRTENPVLMEDVRIELYGTMLGWRPGDRQHLAEIAGECGLADIVNEYPGRVTYRRSLELLLKSDGVLILGVDDSGYMPSKLFNYALAQRPLLASLRRDGPALAAFQDKPQLGHALWFAPSDEIAESDAAEIVGTFLEEVVARQSFDRQALLQPNLAAAMARDHIALFESCLRHSHQGGRKVSIRGNEEPAKTANAQSR